VRPSRWRSCVACGRKPTFEVHGGRGRLHRARRQSRHSAACRGEAVVSARAQHDLRVNPCAHPRVHRRALPGRRAARRARPRSVQGPHHRSARRRNSRGPIDSASTPRPYSPEKAARSARCRRWSGSSARPSCSLAYRCPSMVTTRRTSFFDWEQAAGGIVAFAHYFEVLAGLGIA